MKLRLTKALALAVYPFILPDALKIAFTAFGVPPLRGRIRSAGLRSLAKIPRERA